MIHLGGWGSLLPSLHRHQNQACAFLVLRGQAGRGRARWARTSGEAGRSQYLSPTAANATGSVQRGARLSYGSMSSKGGVAGKSPGWGRPRSV